MSSTVIYDGPSNLLALVERDGFFVLPTFFHPDRVLEARREVEGLLEESEKVHLKARAEDPHSRLGLVDKSTPYKSLYEDDLHTQFFFSSRSPAYARLLNDMFSHEVIKTFMKGLAGEFRLRVDLCQRAKGTDDSTGLPFQGPLPWHRDTPGEFTFGILLDHNPEPGWGGTTFIPGTHWNPLNPRWDVLAADKQNMTALDLYGRKDMRLLPDDYLRYAPLNGMLRKTLAPKVVEATGQRGGLYLFLNDTWHGRAANRTGRRNMASRIGGFATDFAFKDDVPLPDASKDLPEPLRTHYLGPWKTNEDQNTLLRRMARGRRTSPLSFLAQQEKKLLLQRFVQKAEKVKAEKEAAQANT